MTAILRSILCCAALAWPSMTIAQQMPVEKAFANDDLLAVNGYNINGGKGFFILAAAHNIDS